MSEGLYRVWRFKELSDKRYLYPKAYFNLIFGCLIDYHKEQL